MWYRLGKSEHFFVILYMEGQKKATKMYSAWSVSHMVLFLFPPLFIKQKHANLLEYPFL